MRVKRKPWSVSESAQLSLLSPEAPTFTQEPPVVLNAGDTHQPHSGTFRQSEHEA